MNYLQLFKELANRYILRGFATLQEKAHLASIRKELEEGEQAETKPAADAVEALPAEEPTDEGGEEGGEEKGEEGEEKMSAVEIKKAINEGIAKAVKEHIDLKEKRAGIYNPEVADARKAYNLVVKQFVKAVANNDAAKLKDMSSTPADGGYAINTELYAEIQHLITQYGVARREMFFTFVEMGSIKINNLATDVVVYWVDEMGEKKSTGAKIGQVTLALKKLAAIVPLSDELLEDAEIDYAAFLSERVAEGMAREEDEEFFAGTGVVFTGILNNANVNVVTMEGTDYEDLTADDLMDMEDETPASALPNAKYYAHRTIRTIIRKLKDENGQYVYQAPSQNAPAMLCGYPYVSVEAMPKVSDSEADSAFVLFGDLRKACWFGAKRNGMVVNLFNSGLVRNTDDDDDLNLITQDMTALRFVERVGFVAVLPGAVTVLKTAAESA